MPPNTPVRYTPSDVELISNVICTNFYNDAFIIKASVRVFSCDTGVTELYICDGLNCTIERLTYFNDVTYATRASALLAAGYLLDGEPLPNDDGNTTTTPSSTTPNKSVSAENNKSVSADVNGTDKNNAANIKSNNDRTPVYGPVKIKPSMPSMPDISINITTPDDLSSGVDYEDASRKLVEDLIAPSKNGNAYEEAVKTFLRRTLK